MAKDIKNHQIVVNIKPQIPGGAIKNLGQQLASIILKELTPAITKAITAGFAGAQGQVKQAAKQAAETTSKEQIKAVDQTATRQKRAVNDVERHRGALRRQELKYEENVAKAEETRQRRTAKTRRDAQIAIESGVQQERRRFETQGAARVRRTAQITRAAEAADAELRPGRAEQLAAGPPSQFARVMERFKDDAVKNRAEGKEREGAAKAKSAEQIKQTRAESAQERTATRAFDTRMQGVRRDLRRVRGAEGELARIEGLDDPRLADVDAAAARLGRPAMGGRLARARRLGAMFPGAGRAAQATGLPVGLMRGGMAAGPILAGIASGNMTAGAGGGGVSGFQAAGLAGFGGGAGAATAGLGALVGAVGAGVVRGMREAAEHAPAALSFLRGVQGLMPGLEPSEQGNLEARTNQLISQAISASAYGFDPNQAIDIMSRVQRTRGGWQDTQGMRNAQHQALVLNRAFNVAPETVGQIEFARRRGGVANAHLADPFTLTESAIGLGFQGQEEVSGFLQRQAGLQTRAREQGTFFQRAPFENMLESFSPAVGQFQAESLATGFTGALQNIATRGIAGAPSPETGLMMLQAFGGLQLPQRGGVSAQDIWDAQQRIEAGKFDPQASMAMLGRSIRGAAGGSAGLARVMTQQFLGAFGMSQGPGNIESLFAGGPAGPMAMDIAGTITSTAEAQRELAALRAGGGLEGRAGLKGITLPQVGMAAGVEATTIAAGLLAMPGWQELNQAWADMAKEVAEWASTIDRLKALPPAVIKLMLGH
jgi:hypothetical protein